MLLAIMIPFFSWASQASALPQVPAAGAAAFLHSISGVWQGTDPAGTPVSIEMSEDGDGIWDLVVNADGADWEEPLVFEANDSSIEVSMRGQEVADLKVLLASPLRLVFDFETRGSPAAVRGVDLSLSRDGSTLGLSDRVTAGPEKRFVRTVSAVRR